MTSPRFRFSPRWPEELIVTADEGAFVLDLSTGVLSVSLPDEAAWRRRAPHWAMDLWPVLSTELQAWCFENDALLFVAPGASIRLGA